MKTNIAARCKARYESEDFKTEYQNVLYEEFHINEGDVINRIDSLLEYFGIMELNRETAKKLYNHVYENFDDFVREYRNYWVGENSLESVSYGEQEEQLSGLYNNRTGKDYTMKYLKRVFNDEGYYVSGEYAYMDISGEGLHVVLTDDFIENFIDELKAKG